MATFTWIGGGKNKANNPNDWSPNSLPQPGDSLSISGPQPTSLSPAFASYTMNVRGNELAGDTLGISNADATINMTHKAAVTAQVGQADVTFNMSGGSSLDMNVSTILALYSTHNTINVSGRDILKLYDLDNPTSIDLAQNAKLTGSFIGSYGANISIEGDATATFINNGASGVDRAYATIDTPVKGTGSFSLTGEFARMEFVSSVGAGQSIAVANNAELSLLQIDRPDLFQATVTLDPGSGTREIDLMGLATADSYAYQNDMLSIYSGNQVIDTLRLIDANPYGFAVENSGSSVNIVAINDPTHPPASLPVHVGV